MEDQPKSPDQTRAMHHFVTRAYLEGMLADGETRLWVYERNKNRVFRNIPKNLASKRAYYAILGNDGVENDKFEKFLAERVEVPGIAVIRRLSHNMKQLNWDERFHGANLIATQELRVPFMRDQFSNVMKKFYTSFMHSSIAVPGMLEKDLRQLQEEGKVAMTISADELRNAVTSGGVALEMKPEASLRALSDAIPALIDTYVQMKWTVLISTEIIFVTSDCPVCRDYPQSGKYPVGTINPDLTVYFPIAPNRVLKLTHDLKKYRIFQHLMQIGDERKAVQLRERTPVVSYRFVSNEEVEFINNLIIQRAHRWVYSPVEMPSMPKVFRGECVNIRMELEPLPSGGLKWTNKVS
jgi:hypothetical protein